jgi:hypothetical protein
MSDSIHFRAFACCKRFDGTVREGRKAMGVAGTRSGFPRLLTSRGNGQTDLRAESIETERGIYYVWVQY